VETDVDEVIVSDVRGDCEGLYVSMEAVGFAE
jgi:hypothetical protein